MQLQKNRTLKELLRLRVFGLGTMGKKMYKVVAQKQG